MKHVRLISLLLTTFFVGTLWAQGPNNSATYYQAANGKSGSALKTAMFNIIKLTSTKISYDGLKSAYFTTDWTGSKIRDRYSNTSNYTKSSDFSGSYSGENDMCNREHSVPASWFSDSYPMYSDIFHVIPTDGYVNNRRSNFPFGTTNGETYKSNNNYSKVGACTTSGYSGTVFEPNDEWKGDFARIYFYMVTCYEDKVTNWTAGNSIFTTGDSYQPMATWYFNLMMEWSKNDPVSDIEIARNNAIYTETDQGNRNPFVDYPGLEEYIWGSKKTTAFSYNNYDDPTSSGNVTMTFSSSSATAVLGSSFTAPTLSMSPSGLTVTYSSSNTGVATVNSSTGAVTLVAAGTTVITATFAGNDNYNANSASYTLTVRETGGGTITEEDATFIFNTDEGLSALGITKPAASAGTSISGMTLTSGAVTMTSTDGTTATRVWNSSGTTDLRIYKSGGGFTLSSDATITKVVIAGATINGLTASTGTYTSSTGIWEGSATSVTFTATATQKVNTITVTTAGGSVPQKEDVTMSFSPTSVTLAQGDAFTQPTLTTDPSGLAVTYSSSNESVATVNSSTGAVTIAGVGTTTITALFAGDDDYNAGSASYTITVTEAVDPTTAIKFKKVSAVTSGKRYLIVANNSGSYLAMQPIASDKTYAYPTATAVIPENDVIQQNDYTNAFTFEASGAGYTIQQSDDRYFYQTTYNTISVDAAPSSGNIWSVAKQSDGTFKILNVSANRYIQYSTGFSSFGSYASAQSNALMPDLYEEFSDDQPIEEKEEVTMSFNPTEVELTLGDDFTAPVLTTDPAGLAVTYSSSNESVATVDASTGAVTIVAAGTTVITAAFAGNDDYYAGSASYTLNVTQAVTPTEGDYVKVVNSSQLVAGNEYILVWPGNDTRNPQVLTGISTTSTKYGTYADIELNSDKTVATHNASVKKLTLGGSTGAWTLSLEDNGYLAWKSGNSLITQTDAYTWAISVTADGTTITSVADATRKLQFNTGSPRFACYTTSQGPAYLYVKNQEIQEKSESYINFSKQGIAVTMGEDMRLPELTTSPEGLTVTYSSSDESVATVDATTGELTIVGAGNATITASFAGDDNYYPSTGSYIVQVTAAPTIDPDGPQFVLVTDVAQLADGDEVIITNSKENAHPNYAMTKDGYSAYMLGSINILAVDDNTIVPGDEVQVFTLGKNNATYTFSYTDTEQRYLFADGVNLMSSSSSANANAAITIDANGEASITFADATNAMHFTWVDETGNAKGFWCDDEGTLTKIYRKVKEAIEVTITEAGYSSLYYGDKNLVVPADVTATTYVVEGNTLSASHTYTEGDVIPQGTAVVLEAQAGTYEFTVTTDAGVAASGNDLFGFDEQTTESPVENAADYYFYKLNVKNGSDAGFYWGASDGGLFTFNAHKAYLMVLKSQAAQSKAFLLNGGVADGIQGVYVVESDGEAVYDLSGRRMTGSLKKGIYITNGRKFVVK